MLRQLLPALATLRPTRRRGSPGEDWTATAIPYVSGVQTAQIVAVAAAAACVSASAPDLETFCLWTLLSLPVAERIASLEAREEAASSGSPSRASLLQPWVAAALSRLAEASGEGSAAACVGSRLHRLLLLWLCGASDEEEGHRHQEASQGEGGGNWRLSLNSRLWCKDANVEALRNSSALRPLFWSALSLSDAEAQDPRAVCVAWPFGDCAKKRPPQLASVEAPPSSACREKSEAPESSLNEDITTDLPSALAVEAKELRSAAGEALRQQPEAALSGEAGLVVRPRPCLPRGEAG